MASFSPFAGKGDTEFTGFKFLLNKDNTRNTNFMRSQRGVKKQKTIALKGKLFLEHQIDILYNFAYSIYDFFANGNFNIYETRMYSLM